MKIVLSRKGFDSTNGGGASPIFPDTTLLSLPIPASQSPTHFADYRWRGLDVGSLVQDLTRGRIPATRHAHLDPDLDAGMIPREPGWRPSFGQTDAAQTHLANRGVGVGDLFLFFGWFRDVEADSSGGWIYRQGGSDLHVLFGWLQVGEVLHIGDRVSEYGRRIPWLRNHPHLHGDRSPTNTIYVAADQLAIPGDRLLSKHPGAGTFPNVTASRTLTSPQQGLRSCWRLPGWFHPERGVSLSYHPSPKSWTRAPDGASLLKSAARGQEFVLIADHWPDVLSWLSDIFH